MTPPDGFDPAEEAAQILADGGVHPDPEVTQIALHGIVVACDLLVQCMACMDRDEETILRLRFDGHQDLSDLHVPCPKCTHLAQAEAPGIAAVIPVTLAVGEESEAIDDLVDIADEIDSQPAAVAGSEEVGELPEIDDSSHPFTGPATSRGPAREPVDDGAAVE